MENIKTYCSDTSNSDNDRDNDSDLPVVRSLNYNTLSTNKEDDLGKDGKMTFFSSCVFEIEQKHVTGSGRGSLNLNLKRKCIDDEDENSLFTPKSEFWQDFIPVPVSTNDLSHYSTSTDSSDNVSVCSSSSTSKALPNCPDRISLCNYKKINTVSTNNIEKATGALSHCETEKVDSFYNNHRKRICHQNHYSPHYRSIYSDGQEKNEKSSVQAEQILDLNKQIFYTHDKIIHYLKSRQPYNNRCVSKQSSFWSSKSSQSPALNRLSWNKPHFSHLLLTAGMDGCVKVWNVWLSQNQCVSTISHHSKGVRHAVWRSQGKQILSCSYDKSAIITDVETGNILSRHYHSDVVTSCTSSTNDSNRFVTGCDNLIQFWDDRTPLTPTSTLTFKADFGQPNDLLFINNENELVSCNDIVSRDSADRTIMVWDVSSGNVVSNQIYQERYACLRLKHHPSKNHFLTQSHGGYVALVSTIRPYKMHKKKRFEGHTVSDYNIGFDVSPDGSLIYSGSSDGKIHCYDFNTSRLIKKLSNSSQDNDVITDVACHPLLPSLIASCSWNGNIALWR